MLRISAKSNSAAAKSYYRDGLARGDYYLAEKVTGAVWCGKTAELLDLSGPVHKASFYRICDNLKPDGTPLTARTRADRRVGYDINFGCPKSVSLVHAFGSDERVAVAFAEAVEATMKLVEADAQTRVRTGGRSTDRTTGNLLWVTFVHDTTRPVGGVPDPQLHSHSFVFNVTHDAVEGRLKAAQLGYIHSNAPFYEACFHSVLAGKMRELGYGIVRTGKFWELEGVPRDLIERFSHRTTEIREVARRLGITDPEDLGRLGARTRGRKSDAKPWEVVRSAWSARLDTDDVDALRNARHLGSREPLGPDARQALEHARDVCLARTALVPSRRLLEEALRYGVGHVTLSELTAELPKLNLTVRDINGERHIGDDSKLRDEKAMLTIARETRGIYPPFARAGAWMPSGATPSENQALEHLTHSRDLIVLARLRPGTGDEVVKLLADCAFEVRRFDGCALTLPGDEIRKTPMTNPVWWVDHAQHIGTSEMAKLFRLVDSLGVRLVLAPSPGRVSRDSPLPLLGSRAGLRTPKRAKVEQRQRQQQDAAKMFADGRPASGMKTLDEAGGLREVSEERFAREVAAEFVHADSGRRPAQVKVGGLEMARSVTDAIRAELKKLKRLGRPRRFEQLRRVLWDAEDQSNPLRYRKGLVVVFFKSVKGFRAGQRYEVLGLDPWGRHVLARHLPEKKGLLKVPTAAPWVEALPLHRADAFGVFERAEIELAKGDVIRITLRGKTLSERFGVEKLLPKRTRVKNQEFNDTFGLETPDRRYRVRRDTYHRIRRFTAGGHIELENGWVLKRDYAHLEHGYCEVLEDPKDVFFRTGIDARLESKGRTGPSLFTMFTRNKEAVMREAQVLETEAVAAQRAGVDSASARQPARGRGRARGMDHGH